MQVYESRRHVIRAIVIAVSLILVIRLSYLQVIAEKYKQFAKDNILQVKVIYPTRGLIYDRNGRVLVSNEAVYDLLIVPSIVQPLDTLELCKILEIQIEKFREKIEKAKKYSYRKPSIFLKNLSIENYGILQEKLFEFKGFFVQPRTIRKYPYHVSAHVLGYIGEVTKETVKQSEGYYRDGDYVGISGLEEYYEPTLRGGKGEKYILVDVFNIEQGSYMNGELDKPAETGRNLMSTIDFELQSYAQKLMVGKIGSVVAIEPESGEILVMVSSPTYDPSLLTSKERGNNYKMLLQDKNKPLFNRAINAIYPPGSTFKVVMALIGMKEGKITPNTHYACHGGYFLPGLKIGCHLHRSPLNLHNSIVKSCNTYYINVFRSLIDRKKYNSVVEGFNNWRSNVNEFGIGTKLGIDINNESSGILPTKERYDRLYGEGRWKSSNILSLAIGQGEISLTPLQLANIASIIGNKGYYIEPHLVKTIETGDKSEDLIFNRHTIDLDTASFSLIVDAMRDVLIKGTAIRYGPHFNKFQICGKTGTAQNPHGKDHSVFISFAPKDNPKIAIGVVVENAGQGAHYGAPISFLLTEKYFTDSISSKRKWIENIMLESNFINIEEKEDEPEESVE